MPSIQEYVASIRSCAQDPIGESSVTEDDLAQVEADLGVPLPPSYRELVMSCNGDDLSDWSEIIYWVGHDVDEDFEIRSMKEATYGCPPYLIPVAARGDGDLYCFDTRHPDEAGEYPIVRLDHETAGEESTGEFDRIAPNLVAYLFRDIRPPE